MGYVNSKLLCKCKDYFQVISKAQFPETINWSLNKTVYFIYKQLLLLKKNYTKPKADFIYTNSFYALERYKTVQSLSNPFK